MNRSIFFLIIVLIASFFLIYFASRAGFGLITYVRQSERGDFQLLDSSIEASNSSYFIIGKFLINEREALVPLKGPYPNLYIAQKEQQKLNPSYSIWFDPAHPEQAVIAKKFPLKACVSSIILLGLILYFLFLFKTLERTSA